MIAVFIIILKNKKQCKTKGVYIEVYMPLHFTTNSVSIELHSESAFFCNKHIICPSVGLIGQRAHILLEIALDKFRNNNCGTCPSVQIVFHFKRTSILCGQPLMNIVYSDVRPSLSDLSLCLTSLQGTTMIYSFYSHLSLKKSEMVQCKF